MQTTSATSKRALTIWIVALIIAATLPYLPSLRGGFVLDDHILIENGQNVRSLAGIPKAFASPFIPELFEKESSYYRPLITVSFQINYIFGGLNPFAYRIVNLMLNICVLLLAFAIARRLTGSLAAGGIAGLAFAALPSHVEDVVWISGRTDLLSTLFTLAAFAIFLRSVASARGFRWADAVLFSMAFLCGLLSKEQALMLPVLIAGYAWIFRPNISKSDLAKWIAVVIVPAILYFALRQNAIGSPASLNIGYLFANRMLLVGIAYAAYLRMLFIPSETQVIYDAFPAGIRNHMLAYAAWLAPVALVAASFVFRKKQPTVAFCAFWIFVSLLPVSNIIPTAGPLPADRFAYLASVGSSILIGWAFWRLFDIAKAGKSRLPRLAVGAGLTLFVSVSFAWTLEGAPDYATDLGWAAAIRQKNARFGILYMLAGDIFMKNGLYKEADECHDRALADKTWDYDANAYVQAALAKMQLGKIDDAINTLETARKKFAPNARVELALGNAYFIIGDAAAAQAALAKAAEIEPRNAAAWQSLGRFYLAEKKYAEAAKAYEKALPLATQTAELHLELGICYAKTGQEAKARTQMEKAIALSPGSPIADEAKKRLKDLK